MKESYTLKLEVTLRICGNPPADSIYISKKVAISTLNDFILFLS